MKAVIAKLGPDPLRRNPDGGARAFDRIHRSKVAVGAQLMDQSRLAGVGNVYRAEILFRHHISPFRPGTGLTADDWSAALARPRHAHARRGEVRPDRHHREGRPAAGPGHPRRTPATSTAATAGPAGSAARRSARTEMVARNLFWCEVCQPD